ncbi:hypothetical protein MmiAt1_10880 [Methanimicrococcus sp. At1]|uniref:Uncharacterized protein n=1 Tax=Methanimicrococcus hacksteinii TaxID=3028293 RepID=A0ABU3VQC7_9EURY|nr:hypothetical protein [Methanimicrococcus sp. At1]MDV0445505.1 hypothetical protein [Methanimicrococcus sp. At1]
MASDFTTGIPEFDRLTENRIEGSFLLLTGNDDEGMSSFLAEIERSVGRLAGEENLQKTGCKILKITPENTENWRENGGLFFENKKKMQTEKKPNTANRKEQEAAAEGMPEIIIFAEDLSELFQTDPVSEKHPAKNEKPIVSLVKEIKAETNLPKTKLHPEDIRSLIIGCLHSNILPAQEENRLIHLADSHIDFQMKETGGKFERKLMIYKYKGGSASGNILRYTIENQKLKIENKKRIY